MTPSSKKRSKNIQRIIRLAIGIALPVCLLGTGWILASLREQAMFDQLQREHLMRSADAISAAVTEGLEQLRKREDQRPFNVYNYYYVPEDILAITDPVAVSPLASTPDDKRVIGYFQIDPDGSTKTPYARSKKPSSRAQKIRSIVNSDALKTLHQSKRSKTVPAANEPGKLAITQALNVQSDELAKQIQAANAGSQWDNQRLQKRGRTIPQTRRKTVPLNQLQQSDSPSQTRRIQSPPQAAQIEPQASQAASPPPQQPQGQRKKGTNPPPSPPPVDVDYTRMTWHLADDVLALYRLVSHNETVTVQGVLLDHHYIFNTWIPGDHTPTCDQFWRRQT